MSFTVAIIGRPNVGKSTFYNRLVGKRDSIVDDISGVTRDRQYGVSDWNGKVFNVIDTGGFVPRSEDIFEAAIREQAQIAIEEASLIVLMTDVTCGITDLDAEVANLLRRTKKPVLLGVNKVDNSARLYEANEFYGLGFAETFFISSITGSGTGEILDAIAAHIPEQEEEAEAANTIPRIAILGRPNVGKSSLLNALLGENRNVVTDIAGTTRDSIHTLYNQFNMQALLIDTAGIRKKARMMENLEFYSVIRAFKAMDEADVCMLILDATQGLEAQDLAIFRLMVQKKKGIVILVNKWDLVEKDHKTAKQYEDAIKAKLAPFNDIPILFISALEKTRIFKAMETAMQVFERRKKRVATHELNEWLQEMQDAYPHPSNKGKHVKIKYVTQLPLHYPALAFFCNLPQYVKDSYRQYLENRFRERYEFSGVPIAMYFRQK